MFDVLLHVGVAELSADQSFGGEQGVFRVLNGLSFGWGADQFGSVVGEGDHGWGGPLSFGVFQNFRGLSFHDSDATVGGSEVDTANVTGHLGEGLEGFNE